MEIHVCEVTSWSVCTGWFNAQVLHAADCTAPSRDVIREALSQSSQRVYRQCGEAKVGGEGTTTGYQINTWHAVRGFFSLFFWQWHVTWHMQAALCGRIEQKQKRAEAEHDRVHNTDTYLSCSSVHGCLNRACAGSSYVWLRPVNEGQSLPTLADTDSNRRLMKSS